MSDLKLGLQLGYWTGQGPAPGEQIAAAKAAEDVGFYYAANALGRFFGTLLSGLLYQWGGLMYSLIGSALMLCACWAVTLALPTRRALTAPAT